MKIGEFAKACETKISVLHHYDKSGLLSPDYVDRFTGYRYYSKDQIPIFHRIITLKESGFSLNEIRTFLSELDNGENVDKYFDRKKAELERTLRNLEQAKLIMLGGDHMKNNNTVVFGSGVACMECALDGTAFNAACRQIDAELTEQDCQRVSGFRSISDPDSTVLKAECDFVKLKAGIMPLNENIDLPFVNDESVVGKWEIVGEYAMKEDFFAERNLCGKRFLDSQNEIYFLPNGERYWCFGWTKGNLLIDSGDSSSVNEYELADYDGARYMFIKLKSYYYRRGGKPTVLVLRQLDNIGYSAKEIARKDDINKPFVNDERVIGKWEAFDFCLDKDNWSPEYKTNIPFYFESIEFFADGGCTSVYGGEVIAGEDMQVWTKNYVLRKWNSTACEYEIRTIDGVDYLIIEWKSGDYRWGGFDTDYYVFKRA